MPCADVEGTRIKRICFRKSSRMVNDRLLRADERLANVQWPDLQQIKVPHIGSDDCLLVCGGFEERAIETLHRTCASGRSGFALGLVTYRPMYPPKSDRRASSNWSRCPSPDHGVCVRPREPGRHWRRTQALYTGLCTRVR